MKFLVKKNYHGLHSGRLRPENPPLNPNMNPMDAQNHQLDTMSAPIIVREVGSLTSHFCQMGEYSVVIRDRKGSKHSKRY